MNDQASSAGGARHGRPRLSRKPGRPTLSNEELLDRALDLFLENGFERTSIDAITAAAGMAKRTVYLRYGDKTTLFKAALERAIEEWIIPVERLRAAERDDLEETLLELGRMLVANIMSPAGLRLLRITNAESARMPEIGAYNYEHGTQRTIDYLADLFRRRIEPHPELGEPEEAAVAFLYLVVCGPPTLTVWGMRLDQAAIERHTRYSVQLFLYGLLPRQPRAESRQGGDRPGQRRDGKAPEPAAADSQRAQALETENRRLRKLLLESMLEVAALKERHGKG